MAGAVETRWSSLHWECPVIFLTVGTQLAFDRLVRQVDEWAAASGVEVFGQIGPGQYIPRHFRFEQFVHPSEFERRMDESDCIVSHAGMGTILSAMQYGKPALLMARRASLGEHRNEHQLSTARKFKDVPSFRFVESSADMAKGYEQLAAGVTGLGAAGTAAANGDFLRNLRQLIQQ